MQGSASVIVSNQVKTGKAVVSSATTHKKTVSRALFEGQQSTGEDKLTQEQFEDWIDWLAAEMTAANTVLWSSEKTYTAEQADDGEVADMRDEAGDALESRIRKARNSAENIAGRDQLSAYGMKDLPPPGMEDLARYAENAIEMMRKNDDPVTDDLDMTFDPAAIADKLEQVLTRYNESLDADRTEKRELENAKGLRDEAKKRWKNTYQSVASQLEGLFRQAGRSDLADRVRPTERRSRGEEALDEEDVVTDDTERDEEPEPV